MLKNLLGNEAGEFKPGCLIAKLVPIPTMVCHLPWQKEGSTHPTEQPHRMEGVGHRRPLQENQPPVLSGAMTLTPDCLGQPHPQCLCLTH